MQYAGGGDKPLTGTICIGGVVCRTRTELNYIGQGAWSAAARENEGTMLTIITGWKLSAIPSMNKTVEVIFPETGKKIAEVGGASLL
jgi:hypothetical protein